MAARATASLPWIWLTLLLALCLQVLPLADGWQIWRPDWLPPGICTRPRPPSIVGTSIAPPRAAVLIDTGTRQNRFGPSRSNNS